MLCAEAVLPWWSHSSMVNCPHGDRLASEYSHTDEPPRFPWSRFESEPVPSCEPPDGPQSVDRWISSACTYTEAANFSRLQQGLSDLPPDLYP